MYFNSESEIWIFRNKTPIPSLYFYCWWGLNQISFL